MTFYANGKLLLTAEYFVLDGATALALPTKLGQTLEIEDESDVLGKKFAWHFSTPNTVNWFSSFWDIRGFDLEHADGSEDTEPICKVLKKVFKAIDKLNPDFWEQQEGKSAVTKLEFPKNWGLGSSSTLIWLLAQWAEIDPFVLNDLAFSGSGYDIACAGAQKPILFERRNKQAIFTEVDFHPPFSDNLYFVFLNQKQNSREGIARYREKAQNLPPPDGIGMFHKYFDQILALTNAFLHATRLSDFEKHIVEHEQLVASVIDLPRAKSLFFNDFWGEIKSLGAWGGDFVLATSDRSYEETKQYFAQRGFDTMLKYDNLIL
jgi:mevalonate kinase